jgi:hypothetical protein
MQVFSTNCQQALETRRVLLANWKIHCSVTPVFPEIAINNHPSV